MMSTYHILNAEYWNAGKKSIAMDSICYGNVGSVGRFIGSSFLSLVAQNASMNLQTREKGMHLFD